MKKRTDALQPVWPVAEQQHFYNHSSKLLIKLESLKSELFNSFLNCGKVRILPGFLKQFLKLEKNQNRFRIVFFLKRMINSESFHDF